MLKVCNVCGKAKEHKSWKSYTCNECLAKGLKWCPSCKAILPIINFHKNGKTIRSFCKPCEVNRSILSKQVSGYNNNPEVRKRRNETSSKCKRIRYKQDEEYRSKELQRCRVREATKENRGYYTEAQWHDTVVRFGGACAYCSSTYRLTREHIVSLAKGGSNTIDNIIPACLSCNTSKSDTDLVTWYSSQPFYNKKRLDDIFKYVQSMKGSDA